MWTAAVVCKQLWLHGTSLENRGGCPWWELDVGTCPSKSPNAWSGQFLGTSVAVLVVQSNAPLRDKQGLQGQFSAGCTPSLLLTREYAHRNGFPTNLQISFYWNNISFSLSLLGSAIFNLCTNTGLQHKVYTGVWSTAAENSWKSLSGFVALVLGQLLIVINCPSSGIQFVITNTCPMNRAAEPGQASQKSEVTSQDGRTIEVSVLWKEKQWKLLHTNSCTPNYPVGIIAIACSWIDRSFQFSNWGTRIKPDPWMKNP